MIKHKYTCLTCNTVFFSQRGYICPECRNKNTALSKPIEELLYCDDCGNRYEGDKVKPFCDIICADCRIKREAINDEIAKRNKKRSNQ
jgi:hypothetical protein